MGTRLTLRKDNTLVHQDPKTGDNKTVKLTTDQIKELGLRAVKLRPNVGESYHYINKIGNIEEWTWTDSDTNIYIWNAGNGFFNRAEAIKESKRRKAERLIKNYKLEFDDVELDERFYRYAPIYDPITHDLNFIAWMSTHPAPIYFSQDKFITDSKKISGGAINRQVWLDYLGVA